MIATPHTGSVQPRIPALSHVSFCLGLGNNMIIRYPGVFENRSSGIGFFAIMKIGTAQ